MALFLRISAVMQVFLLLLVGLLRLRSCWSFIHLSANGKVICPPSLGWSGGRVGPFPREKRDGARGVTVRAVRGADSERGGPCRLLDGVGDPHRAAFYSTDMDLRRAAEMVTQEGFIYEEAMRDIMETGQMPIDLERADHERERNLSRIAGEAASSIMKEEVWGREGLVKHLNMIAEESGNFVCLLGGKSTGKSLLLNDLAKRNPEKVFVVDLRLHEAIVPGLLSVLREQLPEKSFTELWQRFGGAVAHAVMKNSPLSAIVDLAYPEGPSKQVADGEKITKAALDVLISGVGYEEDPLLRLMNAMVDKLEEGFTLVVDEANIAFNADENASPDVFKQTKRALSLFTTFTEQRSQGNVILVSSEHVFPFGLKRRGIDFNLMNLTGFLYAGEVAPGDMMKLLEMWGVGRHLALALLAHYGGHVWETYQALRMLRESKDEALEVGLDPLKSSSVRRCLAWRPQAEVDVERGRMRETLRLLAVKGFAPIPAVNDVVAEVISQNNVGGVVMRGSPVVGLPRSAWGNAKFGLVPGNAVHAPGDSQAPDVRRFEHVCRRAS